MDAGDTRSQDADDTCSPPPPIEPANSPSLPQFEEDFIILLETLPELWNAQHKYYTNKYKRQIGYEKLLDVYKKIKIQAFLENAHADIPKYLDTFLEEFMMFDVHKRKTKLEKEPEPTYTAEDPELQDANDDETTNEDDNETFTSFGVKKDYIAHSIISAIRPKSFISSLLLSTGLYINRKSGSKLIVNLLAKLGVCASYHSVALHELSAIKAEVSKIVKPCFTQYVYDNADHNPCTIDGKNTMHIMGGICCVAPRHAVCTSGEIPKLKRLPAATEVASIGSVELRDFPDQETSLKPLKYLDVTGFKFGDVVPGITTVYSTHIWASYIKVPKLPCIRGLFDKIAKIPTYQVSRIFCLPFIDENPSDFKTIYTALHYAAEHCKGTDRQTCFVTFDYPLYIKAKQILCNTKDENLQNVIPRLGGFHLLMSYLKAIGTIMEGSGIFELFCTVFAQNSVDKMLSCTAYSRAIRAHMLAMNAIGEIIAEFAESSENVDSHENIEYIKESRPLEAPPSFMSISRQIEEKKVTISNLFADLKNYSPTLDQVYDTEDAVALLNLFVSATTTLQRKSPTAELWLQYFNCIIVALRFIEAERLGYWNLHLSCIQQMLPIFHAAVHYSSDLVIETLMPEVSVTPLSASQLMINSAQSTAKLSVINTFAGINERPVMDNAMGYFVASLICPGSIIFSISFDDIPKDDIYVRGFAARAAKILFSYNHVARWNSLDDASVRVVESALVRCGLAAGILETVMAREFPLASVAAAPRAQLDGLNMLQTQDVGTGWRESGGMRYADASHTNPYLECQNRQSPLDDLVGLDEETINGEYAAWNTRVAVHRFLACLARGRIQKTPMNGIDTVFDVCAHRIFRFFVAMNNYDRENWYSSLRLSEMRAQNMFANDIEMPVRKLLFRYRCGQDSGEHAAEPVGGRGEDYGRKQLSDNRASKPNLSAVTKVWSDLKNNTKRKPAKISRAASGTGGGPACKLVLTDLEQRVLELIGTQAAAGLPYIAEVGLEFQPTLAVDQQHDARASTPPPSPQPQPSTSRQVNIQVENMPDRSSPFTVEDVVGGATSPTPHHASQVGSPSHRGASSSTRRASRQRRRYIAPASLSSG
ncbi:unnamed protein product [Chilo suppressalis]|uniref:Uncharacterized protein n=1 Tax=Chilo suppressalis TaxID=168631 RepID=A0ABN8B9B7_CHISP|nr:unnamed protein product [Chilo suppressalis]